MASVATNRLLLEIQKQVWPVAVFLPKSHLKKVKVEKLAKRLDLDSFECLKSDGLSGGLKVMWKKSFKVFPQFTQLGFIDVRLENNDGNTWRFTPFYGNQNEREDISYGGICMIYTTKLIFHGLWQVTLTRSSTLIRRRVVILDELK